MRLSSRLFGISVLIVLGALLALFILASTRQWPAALGGFAAKTVCGASFIAGRPVREVVRDDLQSISVVMRLIDVEIDSDRQRVSAALPLGGTRHAIYRSGHGCVLLPPSEVPEVAMLADAVNPNNKPSRLSGAAANLRSERLQPYSELWPKGSGALLESQWPKGLDGAALARVVGQAFSAKTNSSFRPGTRAENDQGTRAILVAYRGKLVFERYADGFGPHTPQLGWSMAKTILGALVWARAQEQAIDLRTPVVDLVRKVPRPQWAGRWQRDARQYITLDHLLTMHDGLDLAADDAKLISDLPELLWVTPDTGAFAGEQGLSHPPGERWRYASAVSNLLSRVLRDQFAAHDDYLRYPSSRLFNPIGALSAQFETDLGGTLVGSSYLWASPHDWLRLGWLLMNDGDWFGRRIFAPGWLDYVRAQRHDSSGKRGPYGAHAWLAHADNALRCKTGQSLPADSIVASGVWGQTMAIIPSKELVILRLGWKAREPAQSPCDFISTILQTIP